MGRKADYGQIDVEGFERCIGAGQIEGWPLGAEALESRV